MHVQLVERLSRRDVQSRLPIMCTCKFLPCRACINISWEWCHQICNRPEPWWTSSRDTAGATCPRYTQRVSPLFSSSSVFNSKSCLCGARESLFFFLTENERHICIIVGRVWLSSYFQFLLSEFLFSDTLTCRQPGKQKLCWIECCVTLSAIDLRRQTRQRNAINSLPCKSSDLSCHCTLLYKRVTQIWNVNEISPWLYSLLSGGKAGRASRGTSAEGFELSGCHGHCPLISAVF